MYPVCTEDRPGRLGKTLAAAELCRWADQGQPEPGAQRQRESGTVAVGRDWLSGDSHEGYESANADGWE
jgi:hypothetical protein